MSAKAPAPNGKVHEAAELFPMLDAEDLEDLAADIKANGLHHPIVLAPDGTLVDGRNRLAACEKAGIKPTFVVHDGDPVAFILGVNIARRHLSKGQRAMAAAKAMALDSNLESTKAASEAADVASGAVGRAAVVLKWAPDLVPEVECGSKALHVAYAEAKQRKDAAGGQLARLEKLRAEASDLAALVTDGEMTIEDAEAEVKRRERIAELAGVDADLADKVAAEDLTVEQAEQIISDRQALESLRAESEQLASLVDNGSMTVAEALAALEQRKRDWEESLNNAAQRLRDFIYGALVMDAIKRGEYPVELFDRFPEQVQRVLRHHFDLWTPAPNGSDPAEGTQA